MGTTISTARERKFSAQGKLTDKRGQPVTNVKVKAYDENGRLLASVISDAKGLVVLEADTKPTTIKIVKGNHTIAIKPLEELAIMDGMIDFGKILFVIPPAEWHIEGLVKDKMTGDPLPGLTVQIFDEDSSISGGPFYDPLGESVTDSAGHFGVWFDGHIFEREATWSGEVYPDVMLKIKNSKGVMIHQTPVDVNVNGLGHVCPPYFAHKGKEYVIEIDYVTANINMVGPVAITDIGANGRATYQGIADRPFGGYNTLGGRIWGAQVDRWKLFYAAGFVDSADPRFTGLGPASATPAGFTKLAEGTNKIWDGPIYKWSTTGLDATYTAILVVWDKAGNEYHDTQVLFFHNTVITPPAQILSPAPGANVSKKATGTTLEIRGNASDDYFRQFALYWAGPTQTELTGAGYTPAVGGWTSPVLNGKLADFEIGSKPVGPYLVRLEVWDRTIANDGHDVNIDWTWNTIDISA